MAFHVDWYWITLTQRLFRLFFRFFTRLCENCLKAVIQAITARVAWVKCRNIKTPFASWSLSKNITKIVLFLSFWRCWHKREGTPSFFPKRLQRRFSLLCLWFKTLKSSITAFKSWWKLFEQVIICDYMRQSLK